MHEIPWNLTRTAAPVELIDAVKLKDHLRITHDLEDSVVVESLRVAGEAVENELSRSLLAQTWVLRLDRFPAWEMYLPRPPLKTLTSIQYVDIDGNTQVLASSEYTADAFSEPARVEPAHGKSWPSTRDVPNAVVVTYDAGVDDPNKVPRLIHHAVKMTAGDLYEHRERSAEEAVRQLDLYERLVANHRVYHEFVYR